ncbi:MAG: hypothetical protein E6I78_11310 [Chloroflexi bacterium]|nr:MAG: hypothetical protein E6I78_11310 [Chloroflexota bacterium]
MDDSVARFRWLRVPALVTVVGLLVAACGTSSPTTSNLAKDQTLRVNIVTEPNSLDPGQEQYSYEGAVGASISEALLKIKPDLSDAAPATAASYSVSSDGLTWTFKIRSNAKWSDGKPVTGADFVYAWQRILDPRLAAPYADPFFDGTIAGAADYGSLDAVKDAAKIPASSSSCRRRRPSSNGSPASGCRPPFARTWSTSTAPTSGRPRRPR